MDRLALYEGQVSAKELVEDDRYGPTVEQQVVMAPHEAICGIRHLEERQLHQGRTGQADAVAALLGEVCGQPHVLLDECKPAPIIRFPGELGMLVHDLQGSLHAGPDEGSAEDSVSFDHALPGALESDRI